jgi:putative ATP-binding cassette transporter
MKEKNTADEQLADEKVRPRELLKRFWRAASLFWLPQSRTVARPLSCGLLLVIVLLVAVAYVMNLWNRAIFDGLQNKDANAVATLSLIYFGLLAASVGLSIVQTYLRMALQRSWRAWLNDNLVDRWISHGRYYQLNLVRGDHANPEYRIADDVRIATESPVDFVSGITQALLSAITFIAVLWTIGGAWTSTWAAGNSTSQAFLSGQQFFTP